MHKLPEQRESNTPDQPYLSCSPVTSTSASRSSSAAFFCMVFPIPSMSLQTHGARRSPRGRTNKQPHAHTKTWFCMVGRNAQVLHLFSAVHLKRNQCSLKKKKKNTQKGEVREACNQTSKQYPRVCPYPSNTMESGEELFCLLFLCGVRMVFIPSRERSSRNTCSHSAVTARRSARSSITLPTLPRKRADFHPDARMRALFPRVTPCDLNAWCDARREELRRGVSAHCTWLFGRWLATHGTDARFSPRCDQCPSTKPPHWEDSALVTGGVNRRGGVNVACGCAWFIHRLIRWGGEWWMRGWWSRACSFFLTSDFKERICCDYVILMKF